MSNILPFKKLTASERHKGKSLCRHGHHKWQVEKKSQFDVKQGKLVTILRCTRCGLSKNRVL